MKKLTFLIILALASAVLALGQAQGPGVTPGSGTTYTGGYAGQTPGWTPAAGTNPPVLYGGDELGAHLGYGRGCVMCHAPHGGAEGNGITTTDSYNGEVALWGQNLAPLYGAGIAFSGDGNFAKGSTTPNSQLKYPVTLPSNPLAGISDPTTVILLCLSCHDGQVAKVAMMKGQTVETLPVVGGTAPTLFGLTPGNSTTAGLYVNEHPVGPNAYVQCNAGSYVYGWDCSGGGNTTSAIAMTGTGSSAFLKNYAASFWNTGRNPLANYGTTVNGVTCTTCHNQHSMTVWSVGGNNYTTMFFIRGYYNPYTGGNSVAQFCRNCHGGNSNEMEGLLNIPTT